MPNCRPNASHLCPKPFAWAFYVTEDKASAMHIASGAAQFHTAAGHLIDCFTFVRRPSTSICAIYKSQRRTAELVDVAGIPTRQTLLNMSLDQVALVGMLARFAGSEKRSYATIDDEVRIRMLLYANSKMHEGWQKY
ncbi:hypothetical protein CERSUDRAFT_96241 [Gelatoporia subvermispora B]|uniref:Uncharacterized protein n=1 Tax=Ceriporiopsis subvermispora (strain B) TaxID=914234 RepID=M2RCA0_CERS8|nr:hypothetical protein CERSUDRAFT_96241 [Gelatoporia subvermispora B]